MSGANIEIGWNLIPDNDFAYFQLYRNGEPLVTSTELYYLDEDFFPTMTLKKRQEATLSEV